MQGGQSRLRLETLVKRREKLSHTHAKPKPKPRAVCQASTSLHRDMERMDAVVVLCLIVVISGLLLFFIYK